VNQQNTRAMQERFAQAVAERERRQAKKLMAQRGYRDEETGEWVGGLLAFIRYYWHILEPGTVFRDGWALEAICEHLEAVTFGEIDRLLVNVPPGFMKSLVTDVFWPAWEWGPMDLAHLRYVAFSYSASITERDNDKFGVLIGSPEYQRMWGDRVKLRKRGQGEVSNSKHGRKFASSVGGVGTGERGDRVIFDDPHNVKDSESLTVLPETVRWFREAMSNRLNDMKTGAIVIIMQRVHEADVSGTIIEEGMDYTHLMIPMEFDWDRVTDPDTGEAIPNGFGWVDPRWQPERDDCDGELAWPERFDEKEVARLKKDVGPHAWAGQYQQTPKSRGTSIISREYWQLWDDSDGKFPPFEYIVASLDSAYTKDKQNDPSGFTMWGVFRNERGHRRIMLIHAWRKRLILHGPKVVKKPNEHVSMYRRRAMPHWGLVEWAADSCSRFQADKLLIEAKASGIDVANEMRRLHAREGWDIELVPVSQDKVSRAVAVQPTFSQGMVYAPDRQWAQDVIDEMDVFPKGRWDDLTDSATQAIKHLRAIGMASSDEEAIAEERENVKPKKKMKPLYPGMRAT